MIVYSVRFSLKANVQRSDASDAERLLLPSLVYCVDVPTAIAKVEALNLVYYAVDSVMKTPNILLQ